MKKIILLALISLFTFSSALAGKKCDKQKPTEDDFRREASIISEKLKLSTDSAKNFEAVYVAYKNEVIAAMESLNKGDCDGRQKLTEEQIDARNRARLSHARKMLDIRENYYDKFAKVLKPSQIDRMYNIEKKLVDRKRHEMEQRKAKRDRDAKHRGDFKKKKNKARAEYLEKKSKQYASRAEMFEKRAESYAKRAEQYKNAAASSNS